MQHSKNKADNHVHMPAPRMDEPEEDDLPVTIMTAVSVPAWKTPSVFQDTATARKSTDSNSHSNPSVSPFTGSSDSDADLLELEALAGEKDTGLPDAVILAERDVKPSLWARLVSFVSQYSPLSVSDSDLSRINLYLCAGGLIFAVVIFIFVVLM